MTVTFNSDTGKLRLDQPTFDRLVSLANGDTTPGPAVDALRQAGALVNDTPHPALESGLRAVTDSVCQLRLDLIDDRGDEKSGDGWISRDGTALLLDVPGGARDLICLEAELLPAAIARVVRLGPHPALDSEPLPMTRDVFEGLLAATQADRRAAADRLALDESETAPTDLVNRLVTGPWRRWTATMAWYAPGGEPATNTLQVLDTDACLCLCEVSGVNAALWPTNATTVWRRLTLLLPDEIDGG